QPSRPCISVIIPRTTSPGRRPRACARSGSTRAGSNGRTRRNRTRRSAAWPNCRRCSIAGANPRSAPPPPHTENPLRRRVFCTQPTSDGAAAVFAVRFLGRVGNHVGLHLLHLAATGEELLHRLGQGITLFLLGFDARQFFHLDRFGLALLAASYDFCAVVVA